MPIFYNFHILLATFYTIFGTNILIQCPVSVLVCCMFFVSQKIHIKRSPNVIKTYEDFFRIYVIFGKNNQCKTMPEGPTSHRGAPRGGRARPLACDSLVGPLWYFFCPIFFIYCKIILRNFSGLLELCRICLSYLLHFQSRIPAAGILPLHVNLVK